LATAHTRTVVANTGKTKQSSKIERESEMKSLRTNSTFGFYRHAKKPTRKNQKSYFLKRWKQKNNLVCQQNRV
jgi:hypothetical protein